MLIYIYPSLKSDIFKNDDQNHARLSLLDLCKVLDIKNAYASNFPFLNKAGLDSIEVSLNNNGQNGVRKTQE